MPQPIQVTHGQVEFCLCGLKGKIPLDRFIRFDQELVEKTAGLEVLDDPRSHFSDLVALSRIHQTIKNEIQALPEESEENSQALRYALQYWLATLFHDYLSRYDLLREGFGCLKAGANLLKIRYHSMVGLYRLEEQTAEKFDQDEQSEFQRALRDWRNFCANPQNHFLFREAQGLDSLEAEVKAIVYGEGKCDNTPLALFLDEKDGRRQLDSLIDSWFVRDRYDWFTAVKLVCHQAQRWQRLGGMVCVLLFGLCASWVSVTNHPDAWMMWFILIYLGTLLLTIFGLLQPAVMPVLLPRLCAAVLVGYILIFITDDVWKLASDPHWWGSKWLGISLLNLTAGFLSFFYLQWEIGNRLRRTPNLDGRVVYCRAAWLTLLGWIITVVLGLILFHIAGAPMANGVWKPNEKPFLISLLGGEVYLTLLFQFAPFALLIGVILQIFWEDKPVTETL